MAEDLKYTYEHMPQPWRLTHDLSYYDTHKDYQEEFDRSFWPEGGFISDMVDHTLGYETTNYFAFWTAVSAISSAVQRDAWIRFGDGLFPNFFIILVAPPGICHKSTAMARYDKIESEALRKMPNKVVKELKKATVIRGKASPEQLFASMANKDIQIEGEKDEEGNPRSVRSNANLIIRVSELSTFLTSAQYNTGLVDKLTDFYDCKDHDSDSTITRGHVELENIYATMFAATTPDTLATTIPVEAFGGGFMSRCIIAEMKPQQTTRIIPAPYYPKNAPDRDEMANRMIWIMNNKRGEYALTEEAYDFYSEWYRKEIIELRDKASKGEVDHRDNRKTQNVLKLALVLSLQRYSHDHWVTVEDLKFAIRALEYTNNSALETLEDIVIDGKQDGRMHKFLRIIRKAGVEGIPRTAMSRNHNFKKAEIDKFLEELESRELIRQENVPIEDEKGRSRKVKTFFYTGGKEVSD